MSLIIKRDTDGVKPLLQVGEFGYDNYPAGGDSGRVYVGTGTSNIAQAKKSEVTAVEGRLDVVEGAVADANLTRADKYLASQNAVKMSYTNGDLTKIQYKNATDVDYEVFSYSGGDLSGIAHYVGGILKGNSVLLYTDGDLSSVVFTEV